MSTPPRDEDLALYRLWMAATYAFEIRNEQPIVMKVRLARAASRHLLRQAVNSVPF